jgi:hypothetical protein
MLRLSEAHGRGTGGGTGAEQLQWSLLRVVVKVSAMCYVHHISRDRISLLAADRQLEASKFGCDGCAVEQLICSRMVVCACALSSREPGGSTSSAEPCRLLVCLSVSQSSLTSTEECVGVCCE